MAHELGYTFRQGPDHVNQVFAAVAASEFDPRKPIRRAAMMTRERGAESPVHQPHELVGPSPFRPAHAAWLKRKIERTPHPGNPKLLGNPGDSFETRRK